MKIYQNKWIQVYQFESATVIYFAHKTKKKKKRGLVKIDIMRSYVTIQNEQKIIYIFI